MYGKLFDSMYDGTLYGQWEALVTFQQMIILCDQDGTVDITPPALAARTGIPLEIILKGVEILEAPDPYSRTPGEEGRRIVRLDEHRPWGWYIVNHSKYKSLQDSDHVREQNRIRKARQRAKESRPVTDSHVESQTVTDGHGPSPHTYSDSNKKHTSTAGVDESLPEGFDQFWGIYPRREAKRKAVSAWRTQKAASSLEKILADVARRKLNGWRDPQYIPMPATYLNQRRWEDEVAASPDKGVPFV